MRNRKDLLDEQDLKAKILDRLRRDNRISNTSVIANEFRIGESGVRADLAILGRNFVGIEIKSSKDSLRRLLSQTKIYQETFDTTIVVLAERHLQRAMTLISGAEVWVSNAGGQLVRVAPGPEKPERKYAQLRNLLTSRQLAKLNDAKTSGHCQRSIRANFEAGFRKAFQQNSENFWRQISGRKIERSDLQILSNYRRRRSVAREQILARTTAFSSWNKRGA